MKKVNRPVLFVLVVALLVFAVACSSGRQGSSPAGGAAQPPVAATPAPSEPTGEANDTTTMRTDRPEGAYYFTHGGDIWRRYFYFSGNTVSIYTPFMYLDDAIFAPNQGEFTTRDIRAELIAWALDAQYYSSYLSLNDDVYKEYISGVVLTWSGTFTVDESTQTINISAQANRASIRQGVYDFFAIPTAISPALEKPSSAAIAEVADHIVQLLETYTNDTNGMFNIDYEEGFNVVYWGGMRFTRR